MVRTSNLDKTQAQTDSEIPVCVYFIQLTSGDSKIFIGIKEEQSLFGLDCLCPDLLINLAGCEA